MPDKSVILKKLDIFCPSWIKRPDESLSIEQIMQQVIRQVLPGLIDVKVDCLDSDKIIGYAPYKKRTANVIGYMHGGTIFTLGDTLAGAYIWANTDENIIAVTIGSEIKYLKPVKSGTLKCTITEKIRLDRKITLEATFENGGQQIGIMTVEYLLIKAVQDSSTSPDQTCL